MEFLGDAVLEIIATLYLLTQAAANQRREKVRGQLICRECGACVYVGRRRNDVSVSLGFGLGLAFRTTCEKESEGREERETMLWIRWWRREKVCGQHMCGECGECV